MGKPKYYTGQILRNRSTNVIHYIRHISDKSIYPSFIYTVPPISEANKELTPNQVVMLWVMSSSKLTKEYQIVAKKEAKQIKQVMELLYEQT